MYRCGIFLIYLQSRFLSSTFSSLEVDVILLSIFIDLKSDSCSTAIILNTLIVSNCVNIGLLLYDIIFCIKISFISGKSAFSSNNDG